MKKSWPLALSLAAVLGGALLAAPPAFALTVSAVGDIMMGTTASNQIPLVERDFFRAVGPLLKTTDLKFGNFEGTLYDGSQNSDGKQAGANRYVFRTPTQMVSHLTDAGFNVVSLANNHAHDFGHNGLVSTKQTLAANGIQYSSKDGEVAEFFVNGQHIGLIACDFYPGRRSITTPAATYSEIRRLKNKFDIVIVSAHAGGEGFNAEHTYNHNEIFLGENRGNSIAFAHDAIDAGADLILMSGPHVPRGLEVYRDHLVAYSLGNFLTERGISIGGSAGLAPLLQVEIDRDGHFTSGQIHSFRQVRGAPIALDPRMGAARMMQAMSLEDFPLTHPEFGPGGMIATSGSSPVEVKQQPMITPALSQPAIAPRPKPVVAPIAVVRAKPTPKPVAPPIVKPPVQQAFAEEDDPGTPAVVPSDAQPLRLP